MPQKPGYPRVPINRLANGLLGFFGIKNQGQYTQHLLEDLQPILNLDPLYKVNAEELLLGALANVASGVSFWAASPVSMSVPDTEVWHVHSFSCRVELFAVGDACLLNLAARQEFGSYLDSGEALLPAPVGVTATIAGQRFNFGYDWGGRGRYFGPNTRFGVYGHVAAAAATTDFWWQVRFTRYQL